MKIMVTVNDESDYNNGRVFSNIHHRDYDGMGRSASPNSMLNNMQQTFSIIIKEEDIIVDGSGWELEPLSDKNVHLVEKFYKGSSLEKILRYIKEYSDVD